MIRVSLIALCSMLLFSCAKRQCIKSDTDINIQPQKELIAEPKVEKPVLRYSTKAPVCFTVHFEFDRYELRDHDIQAIDFNISNKGKIKSVLIVGHTCDIGSEDYNYALGMRRAEAVKEKMLTEGIPLEKITCESKGEISQITFQKEKYYLNRRAEITIK